MQYYDMRYLYHSVHDECMGHTYTETVFVVDMKFTFNWVSYIFICKNEIRIKGLVTPNSNNYETREIGGPHQTSLFTNQRSLWVL